MANFRLVLTIAIAAVFANTSIAQVVTTSVPYFTVEDSITLTFNSNAGNGALSGTNTVYIHTGLITGSSDYSGDWKRQVGLWAETEPEQLMNNVGGGNHSKEINIEPYYGTGTWDGVKAMAMVFRNDDGSVVGQNAYGSDIYIPVFESTSDLDAVILDPITDGKLVTQNDGLTFDVRTNNPSSLINLYQDGNLIGQGFGDEASASVSTSTTVRS